MPATKTRLIAATLLVAATCAAALWFVRKRSASEERPELPNPVLTCDLDGFRFEYHLPTGRETLFRMENGAPVLVDVLEENSQKASECRQVLQRKEGVADLATLRARYEETVRRLHALGYL